MKTQQLILVFVILLLNSGFSEEGKWVIDPESRLTIYGTTNINKFACSVDCYSTTDTLEYIRKTKTSELQFSKNNMIIAIRNFDCGNKQITRDFYETLKSKEYPELQIRFRSFQHLPTNHKSFIDGTVDITLAGVTRQYVVKYVASIPTQGTLQLLGNQEVNFSDFNLKAPQKMMGLIKVQEGLRVEFNLTLKSI
jgi:hypothetical protein